MLIVQHLNFCNYIPLHSEKKYLGDHQFNRNFAIVMTNIFEIYVKLKGTE